jgi:tight adherence protein B
MGLAYRCEQVDVRMFVTSVLIQKETGGNLAENMDNLSHIIRERFRFKRQIKVHTAHGRMTGAVLAVTPLVMLVLLYLISPDYMGPMFTENAGRWMLVVAGGMQLMGFLVIRRLTDIEY